MRYRLSTSLHQLREVVSPATEYAVAIVVMLAVVAAYVLGMEWLLAPATA